MTRARPTDPATRLLGLLLLGAAGLLAGCSSGPAPREGTIVYRTQTQDEAWRYIVYTTEEEVPWGLGPDRPVGERRIEGDVEEVLEASQRDRSQRGGDRHSVFVLPADRMGALLAGLREDGFFELPDELDGPLPPEPPDGRFILVKGTPSDPLREADGGPVLVRKTSLEGEEQVRVFSRTERGLIILTQHAQPSYRLPR